MRAYNWTSKDSSLWFDLDHVLGVNAYYDHTGRLSVMLFMAFRDGPLYLPRYEESTLPPEKIDGVTNDDATKLLKDRFEKLKEMDNKVMAERIADLRHAWAQGKMPTTKPLKIVISGADALQCAQALEYRAHMEAGQSQQPDLFGKEDTVWWSLAKRLRRAVAEARRAKKAGT